MKIALILVGIVSLIIAIDRLGLWAEARGWVYWRRTKPSSSAAGGAFLALDAFADPGARHVVEMREAEPTIEIVGEDSPLPSAPTLPRRSQGDQQPRKR